MPWIRIFRTKHAAEAARKILAESGIDANIIEEDFEGVPIIKYGVPARFRLNVKTSEDYFKAATFLAKKLKKKT